MSDPIYLGCHYLDQWYLPHRETFMDFYMQPHRLKLHLAPRGHLKTSTVSAYIMWRLLHNTNLTVLVVSNTRGLSRNIIDSLREQFQYNPMILRDFGDLQGEPWGRDAFTLKRTTLGLEKEPTMTAAGIDSAILGGHFDIIWMDDIVKVKNQWTEDMRAKVWQWYAGTLQKCKKRDTEWLVTGTRKHVKDIYSRFLAFPHWTHRVDKALIDEPTGTVLCSFIDDLASLQEMRFEDPFEFAREMQNEPVAQEGLELKLEWVKYYDPAEPPAFNWVFMGIDPAVGKSDTASYTATCLIGVTPDLRIYVLDFQRHRWHVEWEDKIIALWQRYIEEGRAPLTVAVESVMTFKYVTQPLVEKSRMPVQFVEYRQKRGTQVQDEFARIRGLGTHFMHSKIYLPDPNDHPITLTFLQEEYLVFPEKEGYTDMLNALNLAVNLAPTRVDERTHWGC